MKLPDQIRKLEKQVVELEEAISLTKNPPQVKIDQSAYPALDAVKQLMAEATNKLQANEQMKLLEENVAQQRTELNRLKAILAEKQAKIEELKALQPAILGRYQELKAAAAAELEKLVGTAQLIADIDQDIADRPFPAIITFKDSMVNNTIDVQLTEDGRVRVDAGDRGLKQYSSDGWGGHWETKDCRHLVEQNHQEKTAA